MNDIKMVCSKCSNDDIEFEAIVEFNIYSQSYEIIHLKDQVFCEDCGFLVDPISQPIEG